MSIDARLVGLRRVAVALALVFAAALCSAGTSSAAGAKSAAATDVGWAVNIDGRQPAKIDSNSPLILRPNSSPRLVIDLVNRGSRPVNIRSVRLDGRVIGMSFFSFTTRLDVALAPGERTQRQVQIDLDDLSSQAAGLIPGRLLLLAPDRSVLTQVSFPVDVKGSALSVYSVFGLALAGCTLALLATLLIAVARGQLPRNRWRRAMLLVPVGVGLGMTATFTLSATRLLSPNGASWVSLVVFGAVAAFVLGYVLPLGSETIPDDRPDPAPDAIGLEDEHAAADPGAGIQESHP